MSRMLMAAAAVALAATSYGAPVGAQTRPGDGAARARVTTIRGAGPVIQVLPGPDAFADSAAPVIEKAPVDKQKMLKMLAMNGPFSDRTVSISGTFTGTFTDGGRSGDSVSALATFKTSDGASWRVVIDRVAPVDEDPMDPHWGGVGTDVTYHGTTGLGLPLVPIVRAQISYYGLARVYRDGELVDGDSPIHVMLTSQTRGKAGGSDFAYVCWNCTRNPVEQLHLMLMPPMGKMYPVPGGIIHVMWQKSHGTTTIAN